MSSDQEKFLEEIADALGWDRSTKSGWPLERDAALAEIKNLRARLVNTEANYVKARDKGVCDFGNVSLELGRIKFALEKAMDRVAVAENNEQEADAQLTEAEEEIVSLKEKLAAAEAQAAGMTREYEAAVKVQYDWQKLHDEAHAEAIRLRKALEELKAGARETRIRALSEAAHRFTEWVAEEAESALTPVEKRIGPQSFRVGDRVVTTGKPSTHRPQHAFPEGRTGVITSIGWRLTGSEPEDCWRYDYGVRVDYDRGKSRVVGFDHHELASADQ